MSVPDNTVDYRRENVAGIPCVTTEFGFTATRRNCEVDGCERRPDFRLRARMGRGHGSQTVELCSGCLDAFAEPIGTLLTGRGATDYHVEALSSVEQLQIALAP